VFKDIRSDLDTLKRIEVFVRNDLESYLGGDVFDGGCFFLNMLVELTGQSAAMSRRILRGFVQMSRLLRSWLEEAQQSGGIRPGLDLRTVANFIVIALNGAAALYIASRDRSVLYQTASQLSFYIDGLKP
jgi:hypothetical protein